MITIFDSLPSSQGAVVAVNTALHYEKPLGGVVAISSSVLEEHMFPENKITATTKKPQTPMLITHGRRDHAIPINTARQQFEFLRALYGNESALVQFKEFDKGHEMVNSQQEMREVMKFFAEHLVLRSVALENREDLIEIKRAK